MRSDTPTLISAMRILAATVESDDGIANAAIAEAADRLEELHAEKAAIVAELERLYDEWLVRAESRAAQVALGNAVGVCDGLDLAIQVVQAGGALPLDSEEKAEG
jgi:hypothetical protein